MDRQRPRFTVRLDRLVCRMIEAPSPEMLNVSGGLDPPPSLAF